MGGGKRTALRPGAAIEGELEAGGSRELKLKVKKGEAVDVTVEADGAYTVVLAGAARPGPTTGS